LFALLLVAGLAAGLYIYDHHDEGEEGRSQSLTKTLEFGDKTYKITHDIEAYLLIGTDDSGREADEKSDTYHGGMADFMLLFVMDKTSNEYGFLQINRDTMTDVRLLDDNGEELGWDEMQICCAHWYGTSAEMSCENTVETTSDFLGGLPIDGYYSISMHDVDRLNQSVGGVEITIPEDMTSTDPAFKEGATLTLTDEQAEKFVRARQGTGDGENTSRMERQVLFMNAYKAEVKKRSENDPAFINDLFNQLRQVAVTDIPGNRASVIANFVYQSDDEGILQYKGTKKTGANLDDGLEHVMFYANEASLIDALKELCGIGEN
jgi:LCP family protein required for cell wall assembly